MKTQSPSGHSKFETEDINFWEEWHKGTIILGIESVFKTEILINWYISDIVVLDSKILLKWQKRIHPLDEKELKQTYGRRVKQ